MCYSCISEQVKFEPHGEDRACEQECDQTTYSIS